MKKRIYLIFVSLMTVAMLLAYLGCAKPVSTPAPEPKATTPAAAPKVAPAPAAKPAAQVSQKKGWPAHVRIGAKSAGTSTYVLAAAFAQFIKQYAGVDAAPAVYSTAGKFPSALRDKEIEMAMQSSYTVYQSFAGSGKEGVLNEGPTLTCGQDQAWIFMVKPGSKIKTPADLKGKRFMGKWPGSEVGEPVLEALTKVFNFKELGVTVLPQSGENDVVAGFREGVIDAAYAWVSPKTPWVEEMLLSKDMEFGSLSEQTVAEILKQFPGFIPVTLPANCYKGQDKPINTFGYTRVVQIRRDLPDDLVYAIAASVYDHWSEAVTYHPLLEYSALPGAINPKILVSPIHPGAVQYYKAKGFWTDESEKVQAQFVNKYWSK